MFTILRSEKIQKVLIVLLSTGIFLGTSLPGLYDDAVNPDGINWHARSTKFMEALKTRDYPDTYQQYHPGIMLMWISAPVLDKVSHDLVLQGHKYYATKDYLTLDYYAKLSIVLAETMLYLITMVYLFGLVDKKYVLIFSVLTVLEPYALGDRRLYHLDYLMTSFILVSFLSFYTFLYKSFKWFYLVLGSLFFACAVLTKTAAILFAPIPLFMFIFSKEILWKRFISMFLSAIMVCLFIFAMFPALWVNPVKSVPEIGKKVLFGVTTIGINNNKEVGFGGTKGTITLEETGDTDPWYFYPQALAFLISPVALLLILISLPYFIFNCVKALKKGSAPELKIAIFSFLTFLIFIVFLSIADKKSERYSITFFPFLFLIVAYMFSRFKLKYTAVISILYILTIIPQLLDIYPYYYAYGNPVLGGVKGRYETLQSGPFGVATKEVYDTILEDRGKRKGFFAVAAFKSYIYIADKGKSMYTPDCFTDYWVARPFSSTPMEKCRNEHILWKTIKVGNFDYWYIYKLVK